MNFKSFILSLCLVFATTFAFAGNQVVPQDNLSLDQVEMVVDHHVVLGTIVTVINDAESCTVTATVTIGPLEAEVSATAKTCKEAAKMILDIV